MSDEKLLQMSVENPEKFALLVERYEESFLRKAGSILKNNEDAEDAVQIAFTKIYLNAERFEKIEGAGFSSWGYKILINTCLTEYRKKKRRNERITALSSKMENVLENERAKFVEKMEITDYVASILTKMPKKLARILKFQFLENYSQKEIAKKEGISVGAVKSRVYRAKKEFEKLSKATVL